MGEKVLVIGSGPIIIGQAAEFDYSGTQGCLALREMGYEVVLVNDNPASIMTDYTVADIVYCEPLTVESITAVIQKEKPSSLLAGLGGQTALNLAVQLEEKGVLDKYGVQLLGTSVSSIQKGEDRELFRELMRDLGEPVPQSEVITSLSEGLNFVNRVGYPVISRPAYTLGGRGGGFVHDEGELKEKIQNGLKASPIGQVILEKSIAGFKEIEYEIMRDHKGTCISVCNMENFDPVGVHTGDSIVVAPSQTLTDQEYQMLRSASFNVVSALDVVGGCNVQLALDPSSDQYYVIEVNPRVSRSSALASKATGYPIAKLSAKLAVGCTLDELLNPLTGHTYASFEPALDYVVVKFPRWPFDKFTEADRNLGTTMRATGEAMAIDRTLEAAFQKAVQSLDISVPSIEEPWAHLVKATDLRYFAILDLLRQGVSVQEIHLHTKVDPFFLDAMLNIVDVQKEIKRSTLENLSEPLLRKAKRYGFTDASIAELMESTEEKVKQLRNTYKLQRNYKMVDTCAAEFEASTNYVYSTFAGENEIKPLEADKKALIIGAGPIRIGQGVEFDYSAVQAIQSLRKSGWTTIMVNNNPETVSTDYETADRLYFEPIHKESVQAIAEHEDVDLIFTSFGGQTALNVGNELKDTNLPLAGVSMDTISDLEDRDRFYAALDSMQVPRIKGGTCYSKNEAWKISDDLSFPLLCRPSYVIGGQGMVKVESESSLNEALNQTENRHYPIIIDQFVTGKEIEVDLVADGAHVFIPGIMEHIEPAGVHSGDSMAVFPSEVSEEVTGLVHQYAKKIVEFFRYVGPMNIQFLWTEEQLYVLEVNPRSSRTVPVISKVSGTSLIDLAVQVMTHEEQSILSHLTPPTLSHVAVKYPLFSYHALPELDHKLGANMKSTGEGMCIGSTREEALGKVFSHLPSPYENFEAYFIDGVESGIPNSSDSFDTWVKSDKAAVYFNDQDTKEAKARRIQALKNGLSVFSESTTFQALLESLNSENIEPIPLPGGKTKGVLTP
ncbi:carbamoyl-phosphate synthase (glutamine-hydrolyzing) large subunit [Halobacillus yeomjeoni]|uniref:carbamoyl-phosphate synthase (glutamine-hydrolyzing) large subunit n=1 Tax=Halobacillus yeomjeoni TaxID=311194 RepID=UPI001CD4F70D|nr:carbamoyl-phosphate synthase (glutamine-hydrolyzing) large subunit [Halobacillus yeomjeoni]MCA0985279.1 carbamoyl-phosphate synthase (glutamine-hydrolyzing) large subunit [Halobacillus yeomjeoni]